MFHQSHLWANRSMRKKLPRNLSLCFVLGKTSAEGNRRKRRTKRPNLSKGGTGIFSGGGAEYANYWINNLDWVGNLSVPSTNVGQRKSSLVCLASISRCPLLWRQCIHPSGARTPQHRLRTIVTRQKTAFQDSTISLPESCS